LKTLPRHEAPIDETPDGAVLRSGGRNDAEVRYSLGSELSTWSLDVTSPRPKYGVEIGEYRYQVSAGVHAILDTLKDGDRTAPEIAEELSLDSQDSRRTDQLREHLETELVPRGLVRRDTDPPFVAKEKPRGGGYLTHTFRLMTAERVARLTGTLAMLFRPWIGVLVVLAAVVAHVLFYSKYVGEITYSLVRLHPALLVALLFATAISTLFHEFGHAAACRAAGIGHGDIGWGIYLYHPVLYTDVSAAWKLPRRQRVVVDLGGMYFELIIFIGLFVGLWYSESPALMYWLLLIDLSLITSLNPILRRDGYWIMSDALGQPNLRDAHLSEIRRWLSRFRGRSIEPASTDRPAWLGVVLVAYSVASVFFTVWLVVFIGRRIGGEVARSLPELLGPLSGAEVFRAGPFLRNALALGVQVLVLVLLTSSGFRLVGALFGLSNRRSEPERSLGERRAA